jgi:hypothetical protein
MTSNALRNAIFNKMKAPGGGGGSMLKINDSGTQASNIGGRNRRSGSGVSPQLERGKGLS